ncbi:hypothetical protein JW865_09435 [Candidatus Bathyarchaeota archaeon]|nr:hypothetical protein [Candidatus Bathyarchaeota archaeon]
MATLEKLIVKKLDEVLRYFSPYIPVEIKGDFEWVGNNVEFVENKDGKYNAIRTEEGIKVLL